MPKSQEPFDIGEFLTQEAKFIQEVFQSVTGTTEDDDPGSDEEVVSTKKLKAIPTKQVIKPEGAKSVKNELRKKTLESKKIKTKTSGKVKSKGKTQKQKQKANKLLKNRVKTKLKVSPVKETIEPKKEQEKVVFNAKDKMVFTKFDFSSMGSEKENAKKSETPKKLLKKIVEQKEKIQKLVKEDKKDQATLLKEKTSWQTALKKIKGIKVKDDPELLKKTIRKGEQLKKHSAKKWKDRQKKVKQEIAGKQQKRTENIAKRKEDKKANVRKKAIKKGRIVPGF